LSTLREAHRMAAAGLTINLRADTKVDKQEWITMRQCAWFENHLTRKSYPTLGRLQADIQGHASQG